MSAVPQATASDETTDAAATRSSDQGEQQSFPQAQPGSEGDNLEDEDVEQDEQDEDEEEPKLKYAKLTGSLPGVYRNGDSTSSFCVAGDKMVLGTHNGNIHVLSLPSLQGIRTYHAHSATITSCSVSPVPLPPIAGRKGENEPANLVSSASSAQSKSTPSRSNTNTASSRNPRPPQPVVPNIPQNAIYIATSSLDGHVCISSLVDPKDVQLRNFARPVNAVALSPDYKSDRTYLSGGRAGHLVLTVGGKAGASVDANTNSTAAAASGWFGAIGLGANTGRDTILHQGEGVISTVRWSLSGKWVVWVNEEGIKIMRSHLRLDSEASEDAWRRVAHATRPNRKTWEDMAGVWRARAEWVDETGLESEELSDAVPVREGEKGGTNGAISSTPAKGVVASKRSKVEKLVVGWGDTAWVLHVNEGGKIASGRHAGERQIGSADIVHKLQFRDCIVSGLTLYTPSLLAILAYRTRDDDDKPIAAADAKDTPRKGRQQRHTGLAPQLRLVNVRNGEEVDLDELSISRFETLSAQDYHLSTLYIPPPLPEKDGKGSKGALEGLWEASGGHYASRMFSSSASVMSRDSSGPDENGHTGISSPRGGSLRGVTPTPRRATSQDAHPYTTEHGLKMFIQSPYDCVVAVKRDLGDHLKWLLKHQQYAKGWDLLDSHPDIVESEYAERISVSSGIASPTKAQGSLADFFADDDSQTSASHRGQNSATAKEKRRVGELWLAQLVASEQWTQAGQVAGKVLEGNSTRWEHWVFVFAQAGRFDEITPFIPDHILHPPLPSLVYEVVLGHYIIADPERLGGLLEKWEEGLFDVRSVISALESRIRSGEVQEDGQDWRCLMEALAKLYLVNGHVSQALRAYIRTQNEEAVMTLIREETVADALADDVPGFVLLKVSKEQLRSAPLSELEEASAESISLLAEEAYRGAIAPATIIKQLQQRGKSMQSFLFFFLRALWRGSAHRTEMERAPRRKFDRRIDEGHAMVEDHADLAVELFAEYDRELLLEFLRASELYSYDRAVAICERRHYIPELVHVLSKTGQLKRALSLIIGELGDVTQAIGFAKENPDLWEDLLEYAMDKPKFIQGLLCEVGTAVDPVDLVRRIPGGLEIEGLKDGIMKLVREYEIQHSISEGVSRVLEGEVALGMETLRTGQRKGVKFQVLHSNDHDHDAADEVDVATKDISTNEIMDGEALSVPRRKIKTKEVPPGHCIGCGGVFHEEEKEPLLGFACGHVYHLSCLLRADEQTADPKVFDRVMSQLGYESGDSDEDDEATRPVYTGRSVGAKVAHAHIIRNAVRGGCQHCVIPEGA